MKNSNFLEMYGGFFLNFYTLLLQFLLLIMINFLLYPELYYLYIILFIQAQVGLLVILLVAIFDFFIGSFLGPQNEQSKARGFVGFNGKLDINTSKYSQRH